MFGSGIDRRFKLDNVDLLFFSTGRVCACGLPNVQRWIGKQEALLCLKKIIVSLFRMDNLNAQYSRTEGDTNKVLPFFYFRPGTLHSQEKSKLPF